MKLSTDVNTFLRRGRKTPYNSRHVAFDQMHVCLTDNCNADEVDLTRFCVNPDKEEGVGRLAASGKVRFDGQESSAGRQFSKTLNIAFVTFLVLITIAF